MYRNVQATIRAGSCPPPTLALRFPTNRFRVFLVLRRAFSSLVPFVSVLSLLAAEPLSRKTDVDFFRDVPSRNLKGLATRSDGRLVAGPALSEITATPPADLLWCLEPTGDPSKWLIGTGPEGRVIEVTVDADKP